MGREAAGVRGIRLGDGQELIALIVVGEGHILTASETRLRQADAARGIPVARPRRPGRHRAADLGSQRHDRGGAAGHGRSGNHADQLDRHAGAHAGRRNLGARTQHPGRAPDPACRRRAAHRHRADRARLRGRRLTPNERSAEPAAAALEAHARRVEANRRRRAPLVDRRCSCICSHPRARVQFRRGAGDAAPGSSASRSARN